MIFEGGVLQRDDGGPAGLYDTRDNIFSWLGHPLQKSDILVRT